MDCARDGSGTVPARGSFERLLRKLQALPNRPAVVVLNAYSFIRGSVGSYLKVWVGLRLACGLRLGQRDKEAANHQHKGLVSRQLRPAGVPHAAAS